MLNLALLANHLSAQTYQELSDNIGIQHVFQNETLMGEGVAFDDDDVGYDDLYLTGENSRDYLYRNNENGTNNNWVQFKLENTVSNKDAFGAHLLAYARGYTFLRELDIGASYGSQNSSIQYGGLGNVLALDSVLVILIQEVNLFIT